MCDTDLVGGDEVADEEQDVHQDMLGDGDDVGAGDFEHLDVALYCSIEVDMVRPDAGGDADLEVLCGIHELAGEVARVEGRGDQDVSLVRGGDEGQSD